MATWIRPGALHEPGDRTAAGNPALGAVHQPFSRAHACENGARAQDPRAVAAAVYRARPRRRRDGRSGDALHRGEPAMDDGLQARWSGDHRAIALRRFSGYRAALEARASAL